MKSTHSRSERKSAADSIKNLLDMLRKNNNNPEKPGLAESLTTPGRFEMFSRSADGMLLDFSRVRVDQDDFDTLVRLAGCCGLAQARERLFSGAAVNETEHRPAMHMAMRMQELLEVVPGEDARRVRETGERMREMAESLHVGRLPGNPSQRVTDIIHVGIGGSMLGPQLLCEALPPGGGDAPSVHFLGSVDACPRERLLPRLKPETTVVILASKSFSTPDTLMHGERLLGWLQQSLGDRANQRMFAVTAAESRAAAFGIPVEQILYLPEWVGGRYSLWSAVSLVAAAQSGPGAFDELLEGCKAPLVHRRFGPLAGRDVAVA